MNNILVIEDNKKDLTLIREFLTLAAFDHQLFHSSSLTVGISMIEKLPIDIVLLDLSLDDSKGFNTLLQYMDNASSIPVIVFTGNKNEVVGIQSVKAGAQDFLVKGEFDYKHLVKSIEYSMQRFKEKADLLKSVKQLSIKQKKGRVIRRIANYANWEMDIVNNKMKWSKELFDILEIPYNTLTIGLLDYLNYVHVHDKEKVETFFEDAIKTGQITQVTHRLLINGRKVKNVFVRAQVQYEEMTNKIMLFGSLQEVTKDKTTTKSPDRTLVHQVDDRTIIGLIEKELDDTNMDNSVVTLKSSIDALRKNNPLLANDKHWQQLEYSLRILSNQVKKINHIPLYLNFNEREVSSFSLIEIYNNVLDYLKGIIHVGQINFIVQKEIATTYQIKGQQDLIEKIIMLVIQQFAEHVITASFVLDVVEAKKKSHYLALSFDIEEENKLLTDLEMLLNSPKEKRINKNELPKSIRHSINTLLLLELGLFLNVSIEMVKSKEKRQVFFKWPVEIKEQMAKISAKDNTPYNVLIVEDHIMIQLSLKRMLKSVMGKNTKITLVKTIEEANAALANNYFEYLFLDMYISDQPLPQVLKQLAPKVNEVIGIAPQMEEQQLQEIKQMGLTNLIHKPFSEQEIESKINQLRN